MDEVRDLLAQRGQSPLEQDLVEIDRRLEGLYVALGKAMADDPGVDSADGFDVDDSTPVLPPERQFTEQAPEQSQRRTFSRVTLSTITSDTATPDRVDPLPVALSERRALNQLLELLSSPSRLSRADEIATEMTRIQWITRELGTQLSGQPPQIQVALLAMISARAHCLRDRLDEDVAPRVVISKLQRFRVERDLPVVAGLAPTPRPESGSWEEDAQRWWSWLKGGEQ